MPVSMIKQRLGKKVFMNYVPADADNAKALADAVLPGEYEILEKIAENGSENVTDGYRVWTVMVKDDSDLKTYLTFVTSLNKEAKDIQNALKGKTFNGVKAEHLIIVSSRDVAIVNDNNDSSSGGSGE